MLFIYIKAYGQKSNHYTVNRHLFFFWDLVKVLRYSACELKCLPIPGASGQA